MGDEHFNSVKEKSRKSMFQRFFNKYFFDGANFKYGSYSHVPKPSIQTLLQSEIDNYYENRHDYDFCILHLKQSPMYPSVMTESEAFEKLVKILGPVIEIPDSCISSSSALLPFR
jgi:hypothetical protein